MTLIWKEHFKLAATNLIHDVIASPHVRLFFSLSLLQHQRNYVNEQKNTSLVRLSGIEILSLNSSPRTKPIHSTCSNWQMQLLQCNPVSRTYIYSWYLYLFKRSYVGFTKGLRTWLYTSTYTLCSNFDKSGWVHLLNYDHLEKKIDLYFMIMNEWEILFMTDQHLEPLSIFHFHNWQIFT